MQRVRANKSPELQPGISLSSEAAKLKAWRDYEVSIFNVEHSFQPLQHGNAFASFDGQGWWGWDGSVTNDPWMPPSMSTSMPHPGLNSYYDTQAFIPEHQNRGRHSSIRTDIDSSIGSFGNQPEPAHMQYLSPSARFTHFNDYGSSSPDHQSCSPISQLNSQPVDYAQDQQYHNEVASATSLDWTTSLPTRSPAVFVNTFVDPANSFIPSAPLTLNWSPTTGADETSLSSDGTPPIQDLRSKRRQSPPVSVVTETTPSPKGLSDFVVVFENAPGALAAVKKRKKLEEPVRKAAKDVRRAGACHQCRFRKRTCSTGTPCGTCLKQGGGMKEIKCQRESPFIGKMMHKYFEHSSNRRVVTFDFGFSGSDENQEFVIIDGIGRISHPIRLRAQRRLLASLDPSTQSLVAKTRESRNVKVNKDDDNFEIVILDNSQSLGEEIEQWAMEYTSKFVHAAGPSFHTTTMGQILGTAYVKKGLPEAPLVAAMLRVASISFVLRAGVQYKLENKSSPTPSPLYRTVQGRIDSILYSRLKLAEKDLFQRLQALIFRTAGCLNKDQVYPVALVMWQMMRFLSIATSHLSNIAERFGCKVSAHAEHFNHCQRLLLSVHLALFRTSSPLLLDFRPPLSSPSRSASKSSASSPSPSISSQNTRTAPNFNRGLLQDDDELCRLAVKMRKVVLEFKRRGARKEMKGSMGWRKDVWELFQKAFDGL